jgi:hypothetical protein
MRVAAAPAQRWLAPVIIIGRPWLTCPETVHGHEPGHGTSLWNRFSSDVGIPPILVNGLTLGMGQRPRKGNRGQSNTTECHRTECLRAQFVESASSVRPNWIPEHAVSAKPKWQSHNRFEPIIKDNLPPLKQLKKQCKNWVLGGFIVDDKPGVFHLRK